MAAKKRATPKRRKAGDNTPGKHRGSENLKPPWQAGQSGNPAGRPKGSRNKLNEFALRDFCALWEEGDRGYEKLKALADKNPALFIQMALSLLPKKVEVEGGAVTFFAEVPKAASDDEWKRFLAGRGKA